MGHVRVSYVSRNPRADVRGTSWLKHNDAGSVGEAEGISWKCVPFAYGLQRAATSMLRGLRRAGADAASRYIIQALTSWQVWLSTIYYISIVTPLYSVGLFLPTIINSFGK